MTPTIENKIYSPTKDGYYNGTLAEYKKEYPGYDYDYGGFIKLKYKTYLGTMITNYNLLKHFNDTASSMCPTESMYNGYFTPAAFNGLAEIVINGQKNNPVRVAVRTDGKVSVRNMSSVTETYSPDNYEQIKMLGRLIIKMSDIYGNAYTPIDDPGMLTLAILPNEKWQTGEYDRYTATLSVDGVAQDPVTRKFQEVGYILNVNTDLYEGKPFDPTKIYEINFKAVKKYVPKNITIKDSKVTDKNVQKCPLVFVGICFSDSESEPADGEFTKIETPVEDLQYRNFKYKTKEEDFSDSNTSTFWIWLRIDRPSQSSDYWEYWKMFFESDDRTPRLISNWRISMSSGQYAATSTLNYTGQGISPTETSYIWSKIRYTHGGTTKPQTIPRNLDLYVRTIGRIDLWVQVYSQYRYKDEYIDNTNTQTYPQSYHTYMLSEDILSPGSFPKFTLQRKGGNNTVQMWVNYNQFSTITTDSNVTFQKDGTTEEGTSFKFDNNEEITFKIHGLKQYQTQIYIVF